MIVPIAGGAGTRPAAAVVEGQSLALLTPSPPTLLSIWILAGGSDQQGVAPPLGVLMLAAGGAAAVGGTPRVGQPLAFPAPTPVGLSLMLRLQALDLQVQFVMAIQLITDWLFKLELEYPSSEADINPRQRPQLAPCYNK